MPFNEKGFTKLLRLSEVLYLFLISFSFYLLILSRTGEAHTVWEVLHPAFMPALFFATSLLVTILLTSEKTAYKLLLIIVHSVLIHSLFSIVFPAGDLSGQQMTLGRTRLFYENAILHGWYPWPIETVQLRVFHSFRGENFQAALSVVFARIFSIDVFWVHLFLVPVLWGVFTPIAAYLTTKTLTQKNKVALLASLLISAFPYATYFGAISVPNSLGFIFFLYSLYFIVKSFESNDSKNTILVLAFSFIAFLSHSLTGIISVSLLLLAIAFKAHRSEKTSSKTAGFSLAISFIISTSLLPLSLIYLRFFRPDFQTTFTLDKFYESPFEEIVGLFLLGELTYGFNPKTILLIFVGPAIALLCMIYQLYSLKRNPSTNHRTPIYFLFAAFLIILIDYRILKLFMSGLPFNEERLWVFQDLLAAPFVALAIYSVVSSIQAYAKKKSLLPISLARLSALSKGDVLRVLSLLFTLNVLIPMLLASWVTVSLTAAYPQFAPLQTTWYELEAVKFIEKNTYEKYVVIGDIWTIYAGEVIVGITNPRAYYFGEFDKIGYNLFFNMMQNPSREWMLQAMNYTNTTVAYFIVTEPRLGAEGFNEVVLKAQETLNVFHVSSTGKLYVFSYKKE